MVSLAVSGVGWAWTMDLQLTHKSALVTGSSKGIGEAIATALAREGAAVVVNGRNAVQARRMVSAIIASGGRAHAVLGDLTQDDAVERLIADAQEVAGPIDILVNNAGGSGPNYDWGATNSADWASTYDCNVLTAVRVSARLLPIMRQTRWGRVINISSGAATMPLATGPDYSAAKAAMNALTASMAKAVAADGVTVNAVSPRTIKSAKLEGGSRAVAAARGIAAEHQPVRPVRHRSRANCRWRSSRLPSFCRSRSALVMSPSRSSISRSPRETARTWIRLPATTALGSETRLRVSALNGCSSRRQVSAPATAHIPAAPCGLGQLSWLGEGRRFARWETIAEISCDPVAIGCVHRPDA